MKLYIQSKLKTIVRNSMQLSFATVAGIFLTTPTVCAQDSVPGFAPGSTSNQSFSSLQDDESPRVAWVPPSTVSPTDPTAWTAPQTPAQVSPSDSVDKVLGAIPPTGIKNQSGNALMETAESVIEHQTLEAPEFMEFQTSEVLPLQNGVPKIPHTPEFVSDENFVLDGSVDQQTFDEVSPLDEPFEFNSGYDESIVEDSPEMLPVLESHQPMRTSLANAAARVRAIGSEQPTIITPVRNILGGVSSRLAGDGGIHAVGQLTFLSFARDYRGKGRILSNGGPNLLANGPDEGDFTGVDISYGRRHAGGKGWEMRFIGFNPDSATDVSAGGPSLAWGGLTPPLNDPTTWGGTIPIGIPETFGLSGLGLNGFSMSDIFEDARNHRLSRDSEFGSFEFNFLRASAGGSRISCGNSTVELFGGLRGVTFNETTTYTAGGTESAIFPRSAFYSSEVKNALFGLQIGGRLERQMQKGWSYTFGSRVGIYNNRVESRQRAQYQFDDGSTATPQILFGNDAGREFDLRGKDNELAFLGELDFGVVYHFRPQTRARFGYRGIAVTNIADAAGQFEDSLFDVDLVSEPKAFGDLIVGGLYFGVDHAF